MRYYVAHLHRLLDPEANDRVAERVMYAKTAPPMVTFSVTA